jgi:xanthine dehydrogenase/oxidase
LKNFATKSYCCSANKIIWYQPTQLHHLLELKQKFPHAKIVAGNSEIGIEQKFRFFNYSVLINPKQIVDLRRFECTDNAIFIGAALTLSDVQHILGDYVLKLPGSPLFNYFRNI